MQHNNNNKSVDVPGQSGAKRGKNTQTLQPRERESPQKQRRSETPKKIAQKVEKRTPDNFFKNSKRAKRSLRRDTKETEKKSAGSDGGRIKRGSRTSNKSATANE
jgi:hypothetical protein